MNTTTLLKQLATLKKGISSRSSLTVLHQVLFQDGYMATTNLDVVIICPSGADVGQSGFCLDHAKLTKYISALPKNTEIEIFKQGDQVFVNGINFPFIDGREFPNIPGILKQFDGVDMRRAFEQVMPFVKTNNYNTALSCLNVLTDKVVATDGFCLGVSKSLMPIEKPFLIHNETVKTLLGIDTKSPLNLVGIKDNQAFWEIGDYYAVSQLPQDVTYPEYIHAVPANSNNLIEVDRDTFTQAMKQAKALSGNEQAIINGDIQVKDEDHVFRIPFSLGLHHTFAVNIDYVLKTLALMPDTFLIDQENPKVPLRFTGDDLEVVIMPMHNGGK